MRLATSTAIMALWALPALAQTSIAGDFAKIYEAWGFMETVGKVCTELTGNDPTYVTAAEDWKTRNAGVRGEVDRLLGEFGQDRSIIQTAAETARAAIEPGLRSASTPQTPCATWLNNLSKGTYEAESYVSVELGRLRSPDGD